MTGELVLSAYGTTVSSISSKEVEEWLQTGPRSMTQWVAWQPDWRLFDFDFLLTWGARYGPALHQGQWWRWITWGTASLLLLAAAPALDFQGCHNKVDMLVLDAGVHGISFELYMQKTDESVQVIALS